MKLIWSRRGLADKDAIWNFLAERSVSYADRVERRIEGRARSLAAVSEQGRPIPGTPIRLLSIPDIQYVIRYQVDDDAIRITGIFSTARGETE